MNYFIRINFTVLLVLTLFISVLHASPPAESSKKPLLTDKMLVSVESPQKYTSVHTSKNSVSFKATDGSWRQGIRCGTPHPLPEEALRVRNEFNQRLSKLPSNFSFLMEAGGPLTIPVAFHVVRHDDGSADVTDAQIQNQLNVMNTAYESYGYQFTHLSTDRIDNTAWSTHTYDTPEETAMKNSLAVDPAHTLNVYICDIGDDLLGYATFPWMYPEGSNMHGVVILYRSLPGGTAAPYNEGDTATHEIGHYLGLYHTFQDGCSEPNDEVGDTPQEADPAYGCPADQDSCPANSGLDPIENYMDYSDDSCMIEFTDGQKSRMDAMVTAYRPSLKVSYACERILLQEGFDSITSLPVAGWVQTNNSTPTGSSAWFQGDNTTFNAYKGAVGAYIAADFNNTVGATGTISNWLISPPLKLSDIRRLSFRTRTKGGYWPDRLEVRLSTNGRSTDVGATATAVGDFDTLLLTINPDLNQGIYPATWTEYLIDTIDATGTGRIAFRYYVTNAGPDGDNSNYIGIDSVEICGNKRTNLAPILELLLSENP